MVDSEFHRELDGAEAIVRSQLLSVTNALTVLTAQAQSFDKCCGHYLSHHPAFLSEPLFIWPSKWPCEIRYAASGL